MPWPQWRTTPTIDGVDVLFIGPTDLSHSLGHPGNPGHPEVKEAMEQVADVVTKSDKTLGIYAGTPEFAAEWYEKGARYFTAGVEGFIKQGMQDLFVRGARLRRRTRGNHPFDHSPGDRQVAAGAANRSSTVKRSASSPVSSASSVMAM